MPLRAADLPQILSREWPVRVLAARAQSTAKFRHRVFRRLMLIAFALLYALKCGRKSVLFGRNDKICLYAKQSLALPYNNGVSDSSRVQHFTCILPT